ncbi:helix-turn-helix domain-containing protein [Pararhodobacter aggregans]|uniref:AraC family transcriptional regulator n=1 Tax=Pararhodobacter aggregans TaxID=404875 RepID=A0A2T7USD3_9RHOB|nr:helix-turn-helix domain-containing protein [Pararhodobacter aggregans]PVE47539.1 AraC family transcriptional regulator [Pararhodobacter aggregans]
MSRSPAPLIPNYNLFGEAGDLPDVVHCETIETRSRLHDWELAVHRHARLHQVLLLQEGGGEASLEGARLALPPGTLLNVPRGVVHGFRFEPETRGLVVTFAAEMLDQTLRPGEGLREILAEARVMPADPEATQSLTALLNAFSGRDFARAQILRSLAGLVLGQLARAMAGSGAASDAAPAPELLARFEALIDAHYLQHWGVADYAQALAVSAAHLSRLTRAATGRPASALIEDRLVREARRNLVYTNLPVSRIAYALGFEDPAYFTRVFTRATGLSPRAFRQRLAQA